MKNDKKLTKKEAEILYLANVECFTNKQIAISRGITERYVRKVIQNIKKKGLYEAGRNNSSVLGGGVSKKEQKNSKFWRLHKLHFVVSPYYFFPRYHKMRQALGGYAISYRDWSITFHEKVVEFQLKALVDFRDPDKWKALDKGSEAFQRSLREVASKYGFAFEKEGRASIKLVDHHLAYTNSDFSAAVKEDYLAIRGEDGKIWFTCDRSKGLREHEYTHSQRAVSDSEKIEPYLNDMLYNDPPTISEIMVLLKDVVSNQKELSAGLVSILKLIKPPGLKDKEEITMNPSIKPDYIG